MCCVVDSISCLYYYKFVTKKVFYSQNSFSQVVEAWNIFLKGIMFEKPVRLLINSVNQYIAKSQMS